MTKHPTESITQTVEDVYRSESRRVLATLIRLLGDFELAEDALQDAFAQAGLVLVDTILDGGELADYHLAHATRADLCRRLGQKDKARVSYQHALTLAQQEPERRFLERRLAELSDEPRGAEA